jgi:hypothetical protein
MGLPAWDVMGSLAEATEHQRALGRALWQRGVGKAGHDLAKFPQGVRRTHNDPFPLPGRVKVGCRRGIDIPRASQPGGSCAYREGLGIVGV